jgi:hypothetical protein
VIYRFLPWFVGLGFFVACGGRDPEGLGANYQSYLDALKAQKADEAIRFFYEAYLDALRQKDPGKVARFFRSDGPAEMKNALRMGLEFVKLIVSVDGKITELRNLGSRALLRTTETVVYRFRDRTHPDRRDRVRQLSFLDGHWYFDAPDLGKARQPKR